jgi:hypothetical protein
MPANPLTGIPVLITETQLSRHGLCAPKTVKSFLEETGREPAAIGQLGSTVVDLYSADIATELTAWLSARRRASFSVPAIEAV